MSAELTVTARISFTKGDLFANRPSGGYQVDVAGTHVIRNTQSVGTAWEALLLGDVATPGFISAVNLDPSNYLELSSEVAGANPLARINAGEPCLFRITSAAVYARANTAACRLDYCIIEA